MRFVQISLLPGFSQVRDIYFIGEDGNLYSQINDQYLVRNKKPQLNSGYYRFHLLNKRKGHTFVFAHQAVALAFLKNIEGKNNVDHINGIKTDNLVENLRWCSKKENSNFNNFKRSNRKPIAIVQYDLTTEETTLFHSPKEIQKKYMLTCGQMQRVYECRKGLKKTFMKSLWRDVYA